MFILPLCRTTEPGMNIIFILMLADGGFPLLPIKTKTLARPNMRAVTCTQSAPVHVSNR